MNKSAITSYITFLDAPERKIIGFYRLRNSLVILIFLMLVNTEMQSVFGVVMFVFCIDYK